MHIGDDINCPNISQTDFNFITRERMLIPECFAKKVNIDMVYSGWCDIILWIILMDAI